MEVNKTKKKITRKKRERKDSKANTIKVVKAAIKYPLKTQDELAEIAGVSKGTVNAKLNSLDYEASTSELIDQICKDDIEIVTIGQGIIKERLMDEEEKKKISARDISAIIRENTARYTLFKGNATDTEGGLNAPILEIDTDKLLKRLADLNNNKE